MRISGFASGMDIDQTVKDLMAAERIPLDKIEQDRTSIEWKRDAYREMNVKFKELDDALLNMRLKNTYTSKTTTSSNNTVTATASSSASNGSYNMEVTELASAAINVTQGTISASATDKVSPFASIKDQITAGKFSGLAEADFGAEETLTFSTHHNGELKEFNYAVSATDTIDTVLTRLTNDDNGVRAFYDITQDKIIMEKTSAGDYLDGPEIQFADDSFMSKLFGMNADPTADPTTVTEQGGTDATFKYNGVELTSKTNQTTLNGITFNFNNVSNGTPTYVNVNSDTDGAVEKIMDFVEQYNSMVDEITSRTREPLYRDYHPLNEEQMSDMSDREIEMWDEKARSGLLKSDQILQSGLTQMRQAWTNSVNNDGAFKHLTEVGINTTRDYMNGGKLEVDEDKLRKALNDDPESVNKLFANSTAGEEGIFNKLNTAIDQTVSRINERAGRTTSQAHQYTLGRQLSNMDERINNFNRRLTQVEDRYWSQFTAMEKAIQKMNEQSNYLYSQMSGGQQ